MKLSGEETNGVLSNLIASFLFSLFNFFILTPTPKFFLIFYNWAIFFILIARIPAQTKPMKYSLFEITLFSLFFASFNITLYIGLSITAFLTYNFSIIFILTSVMSHKRFNE